MFSLMSPSVPQCTDQPKFLKMGQVCVTGETKTDQLFNDLIKDVRTPSLTSLAPVLSLMRELFNLYSAAHCMFLAFLFNYAVLR